MLCKNVTMPEEESQHSLEWLRSQDLPEFSANRSGDLVAQQLCGCYLSTKSGENLNIRPHHCYKYAKKPARCATISADKFQTKVTQVDLITKRVDI